MAIRHLFFFVNVRPHKTKKSDTCAEKTLAWSIGVPNTSHNQLFHFHRVRRAEWGTQTMPLLGIEPRTAAVKFRQAPNRSAKIVIFPRYIFLFFVLKQ